MPKRFWKNRWLKPIPWMCLGLGLWLGQWHLRGWLSSPQVALVLGGATDRIHFAAQFAAEHPDMDIWISSGANPEYSIWVFQEAQVSLDRLHLDYQAVDTVTNFTTLVDDFERLGIDSVYLITSDYHMRRATIIAEIVFGSHGIHFKPLAVPSDEPPESLLRSVRDGARSILWVMTGKTGSRLVHLSLSVPNRS